MNVRDIAERAARAFRRRPAITSDGRTYSFGECWQRGLQLANGLLDRGIAPGENVAVLEKNSIRSVDFYLGTAIAGLVRVPLYWRNSVPLHVAMLENAGCRAVVVDGDVDTDVIEAISAVSCVEMVLVRDAGYEAWLTRQSEVDPGVPIDDDTLYMIRHTGGTTGAPKGILNTHRQWACVGRDVMSFKPRIVEGDTMLHVAPLSHASGYYFLPAWAAGARQVVLPAADPAQILETLASERVGHFYLPPTLLDMVVTLGMQHPQRELAIKGLAIGSSPISGRQLRAARDFFGDAVLFQTYGTSEAVPISGMGPEAWFAEMDGSEPLRSAGRPLPFVDFELRDQDGARVPIGEVGEVTVRTDGMTNGYYRAPEATAASFDRGWFKTGDLGRLDENGYLYLVDRIGETIISGGHNIYPSDLERVVNDHPDVLETAAFGVPDEKWGETPVVVCRVAPGAEVSAGEIQRHVTEALGSYMKPSYVQFVEAPLPRSAVGKIGRRMARDQYWGGDALVATKQAEG